MALLPTLPTLLLALSLQSFVSAHGATSPLALARRSAYHLDARAALSRCSHKLRLRELATHRLARRAELIESYLSRRSVEKRAFVPRPMSKLQGNGSEPCILAPEVTIGPYYVKEQLIHGDIRKGEGERGVPLLLDLQFVDINTCETVPNVMVDVWHCNTTGKYSGFEVEQTVGESLNRGLHPTDRHEIMHMTTSFPGWYSGRATHIHIAAHVGGAIDRRKRVYVGGNTTHIGQVFFPEALLTQIDSALPYSKNTINRLKNTQDFIFHQENTRYDALADYQLLGDELDDGVLAFLSIGIDAKMDYPLEMTFPGGGGPGGFSMPPNFTITLPPGLTLPPGFTIPSGVSVVTATGTLSGTLGIPSPSANATAAP